MGCLKNIISLVIFILAIIGFKVIGGFELVLKLMEHLAR